MEELLQCTICFKNYDNEATSPRQLPCQHHMCSVCLPFMVKTIRGSGCHIIECPMCKQTFDMSPEDVPKSRLIMQLVDSMKATRPSGSAASTSSSTSSLPPPLVPTPAYYQPQQPPKHSPDIHEAEHRAKTTQEQHHNNSSSIQPSSSTSSTTSRSSPSSSSSHNQSSTHWDYKTYLRNIFNEMDVNRDGSITADELREALRRGQSVSEFDPKTVELLLEKYDTNGDKEISFEEFFQLFTHLNEEFENFLLMDQDGSGAIDADELEQALRKKGYTLTRPFYEFIVSELNRKTGRDGVLFDSYCRIAARFDYLCQYYRKTPYYQKIPLEAYLRQTFFQNFW